MIIQWCSYYSLLQWVSPKPKKQISPPHSQFRPFIFPPFISFPFPPFLQPLSFSLPYSSTALEVSLLNLARRSGEGCKLPPTGSGEEPQPESNMVYFNLEL